MLAEEEAVRTEGPGEAPEEDEDLFVDEEFPPDRHYLAEGAPEDTAWRRPRELCEEPQMFVDGAGRNDVLQGDVGNCWSMAACAAVADKQDLIRQVVPFGQILHGPGYSGRIVIRIWHMGCWRDVEIDDRLPVNSENELLYARSCNKHEFWIPLVEKALAKFHGGYKNLSGGHLPEGFINLTGYTVRNLALVDYQNSKNPFFRILKTELDNGSLAVCARGGAFERGLPAFHGFTVSGARHLRPQRVRLLRVRNPWGDDEWNGKWRDDHTVWKELDADILEQLDYKVHQDGEFWMKLNDFLKMFDEVCIASRTPSVHADRIVPATKMEIVRASWTEDSAGGPFGKEPFAKNPQLLLRVTDLEPEELAASAQNGATEEEDEEVDSEEEKEAADRPEQCPGDPACDEDGIPVLVELLQDHNRRVTTDLFPIGFCIFQVTEEVDWDPPEGGEKRLSWTQLTENCEQLEPVDPVEPQSAVRAFYHLQPRARYVIVPNTAASGQTRRFLLRVYSRKAHIRLRELRDVAGGDSPEDGATAN